MGKSNREHQNKYSPENRFASEMLAEIKQGMKRLWIALIVVLGFWFATIGVFIWYINQFEYESSSTETITHSANGVYAIVDSDGNIIAQDATEAELDAFKEWWKLNGERDENSDENQNKNP